jgi:threonine dehydrogenase-like Zn-dependent dehydrogenase
MWELVLERAGRTRLREVPEPRPAAGQALVRMLACGVCGSDVRHYRESRTGVVHWGHELVGHVAAVGEGGDPTLPGTPVIAGTSRPCGCCRACAAGRPAGCQGWTYQPFNGFAESVCLPTGLLTPVPGGLDPLDVLTEPLYVAADLARRAAVGPGEPVLLLGIGPIGLLTLYCLRAAGVAPIHAVYRGRPGPRVELAARWGALALPAAELAARAGELRCSAAVVTAPYPTVPAVLPAVVPGGRVVYNGITGAATVPLDLHYLHTRRIDLLPAFPHPQTGFGAARDLLDRDRAVLGELVSHRIPLDRAPTAFDLLGQPGSKAVKVVITAGG